MNHPIPNPLPGLFSFGTPCLRWKLIEGIKSQQGFPGHTNGNKKRYLQMNVDYQTDARPLGGGFGVTSISQLFTIDRFTGDRFPFFLNDTNAPYLPFPANSGAETDPTYTAISETAYTRVFTEGSGVIVTVNVTLSSEYTLSMLEADTDDIIGTINPDNVAWFTMVHYDGGNPAFNDPTILLPQQYIYSNIFTPTPLAIPDLKGAAWSVLLQGGVGGGTWEPNVFIKAIGHFAMAGNYCQKTFVLSGENVLATGDTVIETCKSGTGLCSNEFQVNPPPISQDTNAYVLLVPNCVCNP